MYFLLDKVDFQLAMLVCWRVDRLWRYWADQDETKAEKYNPQKTNLRGKKSEDYLVATMVAVVAWATK